MNKKLNEVPIINNFSWINRSFNHLIIFLLRNLGKHNVNMRFKKKYPNSSYIFQYNIDWAYLSKLVILCISLFVSTFFVHLNYFICEHLFVYFQMWLILIAIIIIIIIIIVGEYIKCFTPNNVIWTNWYISKKVLSFLN